jgi:hypothetical protein
MGQLDSQLVHSPTLLTAVLARITAANWSPAVAPKFTIPLPLLLLPDAPSDDDDAPATPLAASV